MTYLADRGAAARDSRGGRAMGAVEGDVVVSRDPIVDLIAQVNRFTRTGDFGGVIYPLVVASGNLTADVARTAIIIHQTRLLVAQTAIADNATAQELSQAAKGLADPVNFAAANLAKLTASIAGYADMKGMPAADYHASGGDKASGISPMMLAIGAGVIALAWIMTKRGR